MSIPRDKSGWPRGDVQPYPPASIFTLPLIGGSDATGSIANNDAFLMRVDITVPTSIAHVTYVGAGYNNAAMHIDFGFYELNGSTYSLMGSTGSVAAGESPAGGEVYTVDLATPIPLTPGGVYYAAVAADTQGAFSAYLGVSAEVGITLALFGKAATSFPLPATIAGPLTATRVVPWLYLA